MSLKQPAVNSLNRRSTPGLEEKIGIRLFVWMGAVALAWAGILIVKYSFERGLISPPARIVLGTFLGIAFLTAGEWTRKRAPAISQAFSAAGIADFYACFLAAHHLYQLLGSLLTFFFLSLTTAVAVLLSLRQGSLIAILGLLGGFLTPVWISSSQPNTAMLFSYLFLLQIGLLLVARYHRWWPLAFLTLAGGSAWIVIWLHSTFRTGDAFYVGAFVTSSMTLFFLSTLSHRGRKAWGNESACVKLNWIAVIVGLFQMAWVTVATEYAVSSWLFLGVIGIELLFIGRKNSSYAHMSWLASGTVACLFLIWIFSDTTFLWQAVLALGFLFAAGGYLAMWGSEKPSYWAALSVCSSICYFLIAYLGHSLLGRSLLWSVVSMFLGALYVASAIPVASRRESLKEGNKMFAALAVGATTFVSFSIPLQLDKEWLTLGWSVEIAAISWIALKLRVPALRAISLALATLVLIRLVLPTGAHPQWHWILYVYGIPILSFWSAAGAHQREKQHALSTVFQCFAIGLAFLLSTMEVRLAFRPEEIWARFFSIAEWGALSATWTLLLLVLLEGMARTDSDWRLKPALEAILTCVIVQAVFVQMILTNPLWTHEPVGNTPLLNQLLLGYGAPAFVFLSAAFLQQRRSTNWGEFFGACSILLLFFFLTLEIRQSFHGTYLDVGGLSHLEEFAYSTVWLFLGLSLFQTSRYWKLKVFEWSAKVVVLLVMSELLMGPLLFRNPLWTPYSVGKTPIWNQLPALYGLPALILMLLSSGRRRFGERRLPMLIDVMVILLLFVLLNLEIRQFFHGEYLYADATTSAEKYTYSLSWILYACMLMVIRMLKRGLLIRYCSLAFMLAAVGKVFLYDARRLTDLYRFFSLLGLGLSLLLIAYLYQKVPFKKGVEA